MGAVCFALTCCALPSHATAASTASAMQVSVMVVRACVVDTSGVDAAALVQRTQGTLAASCGAGQVSLKLSPPTASAYRAQDRALWLDVEF